MATLPRAGSGEWSYWRVLRYRGLAFLLVGGTLSQVGDGMAITALPLQALRVRGGVPAAPAIAIVQAAPYALAAAVSLAVGLSRFRMRHRNVLATDCGMRLVLFSALGVLSLTGRLALSLLVVTLLVGSGLRMMSASSLRIAATSLVDPAGRLAVNGLISTSSNLALYAVGPVLGGLVATLSSPGYALLIDGGSFAALLMAVCVAVPSRPPSTAERRDRASGLQILRRLPAAARILIVVFCFNLFYMPAEVALPLLVREQLHGSGTALGWVWAGFGIGAVVGALATNMLRRFCRQRVLVLIIGGWALAVLLLAVAPTVPFAVAAFGLGGLIYSPFTAISYTFVQSLLSEDDQQPVITLWTAGSVIAAPIGLVIGGGIVAAAGARGGLLVSALLTAALAPVAAVGLHRRRTAAVR